MRLRRVQDVVVVVFSLCCVCCNKNEDTVQIRRNVESVSRQLGIKVTATKIFYRNRDVNAAIFEGTLEENPNLSWTVHRAYDLTIKEFSDSRKGVLIISSKSIPSLHGVLFATTQAEYRQERSDFVKKYKEILWRSRRGANLGDSNP